MRPSGARGHAGIPGGDPRVEGRIGHGIDIYQRAQHRGNRDIAHREVPRQPAITGCYAVEIGEVSRQIIDRRVCRRLIARLAHQARQDEAVEYGGAACRHEDRIGEFLIPDRLGAGARGPRQQGWGGVQGFHVGGDGGRIGQREVAILERGDLAQRAGGEKIGRRVCKIDADHLDRNALFRRNQRHLADERRKQSTKHLHRSSPIRQLFQQTYCSLARLRIGER